MQLSAYLFRFSVSARSAPRTGRLALGLGLLMFGTGLFSAEPETITNPAQIWAMPTEAKNFRHPLQLEGRVSYFDRGFKMFWLERDGVGVYIQLSANPPALHTGEQVLITGNIIPNQGLDAAEAIVKVVQDFVPIRPIDTQGQINNIDLLAGRMVSAEAYVDSQQKIDATHERLMLIVENRRVICWVRPDDPDRVPDWQGRFVRVAGLYSSRFDPTKTRATIELWVGKQAQIETLGTLQKNALFEQPVTPISEIYLQPSGTRLKVRGKLQVFHPGESMIIRDDTGQVEIHSMQSEHVEIGSTIEAVGFVKQAEEWMLENALYRKMEDSSTTGNDSTRDHGNTLMRVADIRGLGQTEAAQGRAVDLTGVVTWSLPESDILFLQDTSGGIRVHYDKAKTGPIPYIKYLRIKGITRAGQPSPQIELQTFDDLGAMSHPRARPITLEQAYTGQPDGEWVEMRGFLQRTVSEGDWRWIHVTTPTGEFVGHLQSPVNFVANPGALIRVHGVCDLKADAKGRITDVTLRVPFLHDITIEQDAPANYYDLPRRSLGNLEQLGMGGEMLRVRVTGTVLHGGLGRQVYIEEDGARLLLFTAMPHTLKPGDQIEAVGILGREGAHTVLRETVFRRTGEGPAPVPEKLTTLEDLDLARDYRLVRAEGTLIDTFQNDKQTRLTLQQGKTIFEARLDHTKSTKPPAFDLTAVLEVTGIYKVTFDESRQARGFELLVRTPDDIVVVQPAKFWNIRMALAAAAVLAACMLLGLAWIRALHRRVRRQTEQIRKQLEQQARLEAEVQHVVRLESLGALAGGIAHDYNNLLTIIMGNLSLMKLEPRVMDIEGSRMSEIERGVLRARDLTRQLLTFASGGEPHRSAVNLAGVIRENTGTVLYGTKVQAEFTEETGLWPVDADQEQLAQVVQNMVRNSQQAMARGGVVHFDLRNETIPAGAPGGMTPGRYVRLTVADAGVGMSAEIIPKIFDPYFSTKTGARGLGLATVYSIISKHGGRIEAVSTLGKGSTFTVWLKAAEVAKAEAPPATKIGANKTTPRVLLMDDEDSIRTLGGMVIKRMGLEPTLVADGESALREFERAENAGQPFSLVILDLTIPGGMGGKQTIDAIRRINPQVPAIVSSGYSGDPVMANHRSHGFQAVVAKPFDVATLAEAVRKFIPQARAI